MAESEGSGRPEGPTRAGSRLRRAFTLFLVLVVVGSPLTVSLVVADSPDFDTTVPEPVVVPGESQELTIQVRNDADGVDSTAENVRVDVRSGDSPIEVVSGTQSLGRLDGGASTTATVRIDVPADIEPGTYTLPVQFTYEDDGATRTQTVEVAVHVEDRAQFRIDSVDSDVAVGDTGNVTLTMTNVGTEAASASSVSLASTSSDVTFGSAASASRWVGSWAPGETKTITYEASVADGAAPYSYTLQTQVTYDDTSGSTTESRQFRVGITPTAEQSFDLSDVASTLRVGEDGEVTGMVTNTGPQTARNVVLTLDPSSPNVDAAETEVAVGDLGPGESAEFAFDVAVSESASSGPRLFTFDVSYRNSAGEERDADNEAVEVSVAPERSRFTVSGVEANFSAGDTGTLTVQVTNVGDEPVTDLSAKLYADAPLSSGDDQAFVETLDSGETVNVTFGIDVDNDALAKAYPAKLDFRYDTTDGETHISETYQIAVQVDDEASGAIELSLPMLGIGLLVLLLVFVVLTYVRD
jgi:hypothetical protein